MNGWLLVLTLVNLILADAIVWFAIAQGLARSLYPNGVRGCVGGTSSRRLFRVGPRALCR